MDHGDRLVSPVRRQSGDRMTAIRAQVALRGSRERRFDVRRTLRKQSRDDMREQHVAEIVAIERAEDDDPAFRRDVSVSHSASYFDPFRTGTMSL